MTLLRKASKWFVIAIAVPACFYALTVQADRDLNVDYVDTHPCLVHGYSLPKYRVYLGVALWTPAKTSYECAAVDNLIWIEDPQPKRFR